jgi:hypothetical protein
MYGIISDVFESVIIDKYGKATWEKILLAAKASLEDVKRVLKEEAEMCDEDAKSSSSSSSSSPDKERSKNDASNTIHSPQLQHNADDAATTRDGVDVYGNKHSLVHSYHRSVGQVRLSLFCSLASSLPFCLSNNIDQPERRVLK